MTPIPATTDKPPRPNVLFRTAAVTLALAAWLLVGAVCLWMGAV